MKAAVYCRVSSEEQLEKGTIENQVDFAVKYCELHNYNISAWYKDNGITGTIPLEERPEGAKLLDDAKTVILSYFNPPGSPWTICSNYTKFYL